MSGRFSTNFPIMETWKNSSKNDSEFHPKHAHVRQQRNIQDVQPTQRKPLSTLLHHQPRRSDCELRKHDAPQLSRYCCMYRAVVGHKVKEETFQLLYGDLQINIEGKIRDMKPGDIQTVLRDEKHSFESRNGAIFEEVSTKHIKSDSYYTDPRISKLDPMERKTYLKKW